LASLFAFIYFAEEVALRSLSTLLLEVGWAWSEVFGSYTAVTLLSAALMVFVYDYPIAVPNTSSEESSQTTTTTNICSGWYEGTTAWQLLRWDPKMKYMIGLNAVFGLTSAFVNSYVNGEVVRVVTKDDNSTSVGLFNAWVSCVAAIMSLLFGRISSHVGNGPILILGAICFAAVVFPFLVIPDTKQWSVTLLTFIYTLHGCGRATFEGTLKATFADYFAYEKEGAFANIILQSGLSGAAGYILPFTLLCSEESHYCVRYNNGTLHNVFFIELVITLLAAAAIMGYLVAASLHRAEVSARNTSPEYIRMSQLNGQTAGH
jgi:Na+/melibiose symporter-like transporter